MVKINFFSWFRLRPKTIRCECGHVSKVEKEIHVGDKKETIRIAHRLFKKPPYCLKCIEDMTIVCPWCGELIFPGDYVTLYTPTDPKFKIPHGAVVYSQEPLKLVGCQRRNCAQSGADYCGTWEAPGEVRRFQSALERVLETGEPVIMNF